MTSDNSKAVASNALLAELSKILTTALARELGVDYPECRWMLEVQMTDAEYYRMKEIITANPTENRAAHLVRGTVPPVVGRPNDFSETK